MMQAFSMQSYLKGLLGGGNGKGAELPFLEGAPGERQVAHRVSWPAWASVTLGEMERDSWKRKWIAGC